MIGPFFLWFDYAPTRVGIIASYPVYLLPVLGIPRINLQSSE